MINGKNDWIIDYKLLNKWLIVNNSKEVNVFLWSVGLSPLQTAAQESHSNSWSNDAGM